MSLYATKRPPITFDGTHIRPAKPHTNVFSENKESLHLECRYQKSLGLECEASVEVQYFNIPEGAIPVAA